MKAYQLLSKPEKWTQGVPARDRNNECCDPLHKDAVSWCLIGAINKCYPSTSEWDRTIQLLQRTVGHIATFNDSPKRTYMEIVSILKELDI